MYCKRNKFTTLAHWPAILSLGLFAACRAENKPAPVVLTGFQDGLALMSDSSTVPLPYAGDSSYTVFYCVRHAEKRKDQGDNPDLTPEGVARAERLGRILKNVRIDKVCTTNLKRTIQTGEAVRRMAGNTPAETYPPDFQNTWLTETLKSSVGKHYFVVGHQNTIPQLLNQLKGNFEFQNIPDDDYGRLYIAATKGIGQTEIVELRY